MSEWTAVPELVGEHVRLERLTSEHTEGVLAAADDDAVFQWLSFGRPRTEAEARTIVDRYISDPKSLAWAQFDQRSGDVAGLTTYYDIDATLHTVAIGSTWLGRRFWRTGINTEAKLLLLTHAFEDLGCARVVWHTDINNTRSQNAIERLGARREGVLRKHRIRPDGSWRDTVTYSMLDDEWPTARERLRTRLTKPAKASNSAPSPVHPGRSQPV